MSAYPRVCSPHLIFSLTRWAAILKWNSWGQNHARIIFRGMKKCKCLRVNVEQFPLWCMTLSKNSFRTKWGPRIALPWPNIISSYTSTHELFIPNGWGPAFWNGNCAFESTKINSCGLVVGINPSRLLFAFWNRQIVGRPSLLCVPLASKNIQQCFTGYTIYLSPTTHPSKLGRSYRHLYPNLEQEGTSVWLLGSRCKRRKSWKKNSC